MRINSTRSFFIFFMICLCIFIVLVFPVQAERALEWRDDGLWVLDDTGAHFFEPAGDFSGDTWLPRVAALSPDGEWVAFVRHTGGGFEDEGQSCYVARWNGEDERLILESDWLIPAIYWLQVKDCMYVVCQKHSGGTLYHSHFAVVDFDTGRIVTQVEGLIYGVSHGGTRYYHDDWRVPTGLKYEILGENEEPADWGIYYVDELLQFVSSEFFTAIDEARASEYPLADGLISTAWYAGSDDEPIVTVEVDDDDILMGLGIYSGWQWHAPPGKSRLPWEGDNLFIQYDRPKDIIIRFDDGSVREYQLEDRRGFQHLYFDEGIRTTGFTIQIRSVYCGEVNRQVAISEIFAF